MQHFSEVLNTEAEYKAACTAHGKEVQSILNYILTRNKASLFTMTSKDSEKLIAMKKIENLAELIQEIKDAVLPISPDFN